MLGDQCLANPLAVLEMPASRGAPIVTITAHGAANDFGFGGDATDFIPTIPRTRDETEPGIAIVRLVTGLRRCEADTAANREGTALRQMRPQPLNRGAALGVLRCATGIRKA